VEVIRSGTTWRANREISIMLLGFLVLGLAVMYLLATLRGTGFVFPQVVPGLNRSTVPGDFVLVGFVEFIVVLWFCCFP
jgi:hypothetical protein